MKKQTRTNFVSNTKITQINTSSEKKCQQEKTKYFKHESRLQSRKIKIENEIKKLNIKIDHLRNDIYQDFLPFKRKQASQSAIVQGPCKISECGKGTRTSKKIQASEDKPFDSSEVIPLTILKLKAYSKENKKLVDIFLEVLKTEIYEKPDISQTADSSSKQNWKSDRQLYAQWILQVLIDKVPRHHFTTSGIKSFASPLVQDLCTIRDILKVCNESTSDSFHEMIEFFDNDGVKKLNKNETDYLIYLHVKARVIALFELMKTAKCNYVDLMKREQFDSFTSKANKVELNKKYLEVIFKLKNLLEEMQKISLSDALFAFTKCGNINVEAQEMMSAYENFSNYLKCVSGESTDIKGIKYSTLMTQKHKNLNDKVAKLFKVLDEQLLQHEEQGRIDISENLPSSVAYSQLNTAKIDLLKKLKELVYRMQLLGINDITDVRSQLISLKIHLRCVLNKHWAFQKILFSYKDKENSTRTNKEADDACYTTAIIGILNERFEDTRYQLQMMDEIEFSPTFTLMADLCELLDKKDSLIEQFKNYLIRIQHQTISNIPLIKKSLSEFDNECYKLNCEYYKYRTQLELLNIDDSKIENESFNMYEEMTELHIESRKKKVDLKRLRKLNIEGITGYNRESSAIIDRLTNLHEPVKETKYHLYKLEEKIMSKSFPAMASLCALHREKEEITCYFKKFITKAEHLDINDEEAITARLEELNFEAEVQINKYAHLGMLIMSFNELMAIINEKNMSHLIKKTRDKETQALGKRYLHVLNVDSAASEEKDSQIRYNTTISDLFGATEELKRHHKDLDRAIGNQWFPSKHHLLELCKEKKKVVYQFQNILGRIEKELRADNLFSFVHRLRKLIREGENMLCKLQSLRCQVMWLAGAPTLLKEHKEYKRKDLAEKVMFVIREKIRKFEDVILNSATENP